MTTYQTLVQGVPVATHPTLDAAEATVRRVHRYAYVEPVFAPGADHRYTAPTSYAVWDHDPARPVLGPSASLVGRIVLS